MGELLIDGHNRYELCQQHNLPYRTVQSTLFNSMEGVHLWMIEQHLGRRSVSDFQRGVLAPRKREIMESRSASYLAESASRVPVEDPVRHGVEQPWEGELSPAIAALTQPFKSRDDLAKAARITNSQVLMIEKINKQAAPEVVAAVKSGSLSISAAAAISTLPEVEQKAAASAGTQQLRQVAKRVKEAKRKSVGSQLREADATHDGVSDFASDELQRLRKLVERLTDENKQLRQQVSNLLERTLPSRLGQAET